jgi:hypothetical protein
MPEQPLRRDFGGDLDRVIYSVCCLCKSHEGLDRHLKTDQFRFFCHSEMMTDLNQAHPLPAAIAARGERPSCHRSMDWNATDVGQDLALQIRNRARPYRDVVIDHLSVRLAGV